MWVKSENSNNTIPSAFEKSGSNVIIRRRFVLVSATDEKSEHYEYEEWQMTADQYDVYVAMDKQITEQDDALIELAELFAAQDDAIVELAEMIVEGD